NGASQNLRRPWAIRSASHASRYVFNAGSPSPPGSAYDIFRISGYVVTIAAPRKKIATSRSSGRRAEKNRILCGIANDQPFARLLDWDAGGFHTIDDR